MKSRKEIIEAILAKNRQHPIEEKQATLEFALLGLQDALLFQLAEDLGIRIITDEALKAVQS